MSLTALPARRVGDLAALLRVMGKFDDAPPDPVARKRQLVADLCKLIGAELTGRRENPPRLAPDSGPADARNGMPEPDVSPRMRQTLRRLLAGDSEKQIARQFGLSPNTVHVYVTGLYRHYGVCSRGELLARFIPGGDAGGSAASVGATPERRPAHRGAAAPA